MPRKGWVLPSAEVHTFPAYQAKPSLELPVFISNDGRLYRRVLDGGPLAAGGRLHGVAFTKMAKLVCADSGSRLPAPPKRPVGLPGEPADVRGETSADELNAIIAAAKQLTPPTHGARRTPGRLVAIDKLVSSGRLTPEQADLFHFEGQVTDAAWTLVSRL